MSKPKKIEGVVLGFDFGLKRIGVAVGQTITQTASPETIVNSQDGKPDWARITELFEKWQPVAIVVGLPLQLNGEEQPITQSARKFGQRLSGRYGNKPLFFIEEQLTSIEAESRMKGKAKHIDDHAAQIILETWLENLDH